MKKFLSTLSIGGLIGVLLASWIAPSALEWWWTPPTDLLLSCRKAVEWTARSMLISQGLGLAVGGALGLLAGYTLFRSKPKSGDLLNVDDLR